MSGLYDTCALASSGSRWSPATFLRLGSALAILAAALASVPALAQASYEADSATSSDEIIVTAQRREQNAQDVGVAIAAFSGEQLANMGVVRTTDIAQLTPGVFVSGSIGGQSQQFSIRGVTQSDFNEAVEAPVAVYIDDVYVAAQQGQMLALYDIDRVEVLKGPQGTLFGRNATGGLVHTIVAKPKTDALGGFARAGYGRFNEVRGEGAINLPLSSSAAVRLSGYYTRIDNYWDNVFPQGVVPGAPVNFAAPGIQVTPAGEDEGGSETYAGRAQLLLEPTEDLSIRFTLAGAKQKLSTGPYTSDAVIGTYDSLGRLINSERVSPTETRIAIGPGGSNYTAPTGGAITGRAPGATWFGYVPIDPETLTLSKDFARSDLNRVSSWTAAAHINYSIGAVDLASVTAYQRHRKFMAMDADATPTNLFAFLTRSTNEVLSQELRLSGGDAGIRWTAGAYYVDIKSDSTSTLSGPRGSFLANLVLGSATNGVDLNPRAQLHTKSISGFGQAEFKLADEWTFILGGRIIREHQVYDLTMNAYLNVDDYDIDTNVLLFPYSPVSPYHDERTMTLWSGKAQLEYRPVDKLLIYAGVNRGVKGGSYNAPGIGTTITADLLSYEPEVLWAYEGGLKYGGRGFSLNASAFYYDYQDYQAFLFANASGYVSNVQSKIYGVEFEVAAELVRGLRASVSGSFSHGEIKDFEIAPGVLRNVRPTYAPRTQLTATLNYELPQDVAGGRLSLNARGNYASGFYANIRNFDSDWMEGRTLLNLSMNWSQDPTGFSLSAYVNNITDKRYQMIGFNNVGNCGCADVSYGMPRTYGMTVGYNF
jgi:iron complex outermembrane recepter protein